MPSPCAFAQQPAVLFSTLSAANNAPAAKIEMAAKAATSLEDFMLVFGLGD